MTLQDIGKQDIILQIEEWINTHKERYILIKMTVLRNGEDVKHIETIWKPPHQRLRDLVC